MTVKDLKKGEFFTLKPCNGAEVDDNKVYIRGDYDKAEKRYICGRCDDISYSRLFRGDKVVYTDFTY